MGTGIETAIRKEMDGMNIQMQVCGLIMMLFLLYFFQRKKKLGLYTENLFRRVLLVTILCVCLDILSIIVIRNNALVPDSVLKLVCKTYIVSLIWVGFYGLVYTCLDIYSGSKYQKILNGCIAIVLAGTLLIYCLPIYYFVDQNDVYTYGAAVLTTYVFAVFFVVLTLVLVCVKGKSMNPKRREAVRIWMLVWIVAAVIQFLNNQILLVGYASSLGMMILFFELENPEANLDRSTGAYNSHALMEFLKQEYEKEQRFCVLLISLERYLNREWGVQQTEHVIRAVARFLETIPGTMVFKNVQRELVVVFQNGEDLATGFEKIKERFSKEWGSGIPGEPPVELKPTYLVIPDSSVVEKPEEILQLFQYFMMQKSQAENNVIVIGREAALKMREREEMEEIILSAMEEDRIEVFYQPIYSTRKKQFVAAEALVRIRNRNGGIVLPDRFIGVAEETGLIAKIGERVFEKVCCFIKEQDIRKYGLEYIECNLSVVQCEDHELANIYMRIMDKYQVDPSCINLEITESASIRTRNILVKNMQILMEYGVQFSLDDFGNGQSNLNYIVDMPVSIVKFDKDMSQAYFVSQKAQYVMEAAMHMIHGMELKIVSEGIETEEQVNTITELGIEYIQGYYFSRPLPEDEFMAFIKRENRAGEL